MGRRIKERFSGIAEKNRREIVKNKIKEEIKIISFNWNSQGSIQALNEEKQRKDNWS